MSSSQRRESLKPASGRRLLFLCVLLALVPIGGCLYKWSLIYGFVKESGVVVGAKEKMCTDGDKGSKTLRPCWTRIVEYPINEKERYRISSDIWQGYKPEVNVPISIYVNPEDRYDAYIDSATGFWGEIYFAGGFVALVLVLMGTMVWSDAKSQCRQQ